MSEIEVSIFEVRGKEFLGIKVEMPTAPLLLIKGKRGFVMCGYLNSATAEKLGDVAVMVSGVNTFEDMLNAKIKWASTKAKEFGIVEGKILREEIEKL